MKEKVEAELDRLRQQGIIEPVQFFSPHCSHPEARW